MTIRCLSLPEHGFYAEKMVQWVSEALPIYTLVRPLPLQALYDCGIVLRLDGQRMRRLDHDRQSRVRHAHAAAPYVECLVSHEFCHQWFYNAVGTNG